LVWKDKTTTMLVYAFESLLRALHWCCTPLGWSVSYTTLRSQWKAWNEPPLAGYKGPTIGEMLASPLRFMDTMQQIPDSFVSSCGVTFIMLNSAVKILPLFMVAVVNALGPSIISSLFPDETYDRLELIEELMIGVSLSPLAGLVTLIDDHLEVRPGLVELAYLLRPDGRFADFRNDQSLSSVATMSCNLFIGLHVHRHVIADIALQMATNNFPRDHVFVKSVNLFCVNMRLNNTLNAYTVFSERIGASAPQRNIMAYLEKLPVDWNSPATMVTPFTLYGQLIRRLFMAFTEYGRGEFGGLQLPESAHAVFGTCDASAFFAHLVCCIFDHAAIHRMYAQTGLSSLRNGSERKGVETNVRIARSLGPLLNKVPCTVSGNIELLPHSEKLATDVSSLDAWLRSMVSPERYMLLSVSDSSGSISN
jgi:hypothetical protein